MKSIFQKIIYKKDYYVTTEENLSSWYDKRYYPNELPKNDNEPVVKIKKRFFEYINILETDKFQNTLSKGDKACIENEVYNIVDVIYGIDAYIYRVNEYEELDDEHSKLKALEEYKNKIHEYKLEQKKKELSQVTSDIKDIINKELNKKWWQFWK